MLDLIKFMCEYYYIYSVSTSVFPSVFPSVFSIVFIYLPLYSYNGWWLKVLSKIIYFKYNQIKILQRVLME